MSISDSRIKHLQSFCLKFNLNIRNLELLNTALTHPSYSEDNYERLEFLGDSVLRLSISDYLFKKYDNFQEGDLTKIRAQIVSDRTLAEFANVISLNSLIILGKGEQNSSFKSSISACAFEALLGVIFLEEGLGKAHSFILSNFQNQIEDIEKNVDFMNPKAILQEYIQSISKSLPNYVLKEERGQSPNKVFVFEVYFNGDLLGQGEGKSKKEAEQNCARNALLKLNLRRK